MDRKNGTQAKIHRIPKATLFVALTVIAYSNPRGLQAASDSPELTLAWFSGQISFPVGFKTIKKEVESAFDGMGIEVRWSEKTAAEQQEERALKVILLPIAPARWRLPANTMGVYLGNEGRQPAVYIFFRDVLRALGHDANMQRRPNPIEQRRIARALGKVVSHEIVHALAPQRAHAADGLMRAGLDRYLLLHQKAHTEPETVAAVHSGLEALASSPDEPRDETNAASEAL
jgi:hypothetical protein